MPFSVSHVVDNLHVVYEAVANSKKVLWTLNPKSYQDCLKTLIIISNLTNYYSLTLCRTSAWFFSQFIPFVTSASALSSSVSWWWVSGRRAFPHGPFSTTHERGLWCNRRTDIVESWGPAFFRTRQNWVASRGKCLNLTQLTLSAAIIRLGNQNTTFSWPITFDTIDEFLQEQSLSVD